MIEVGLDVGASTYPLRKLDPQLAHVVGGTVVANGFRHPFESLGHGQLLQRLVVFVSPHDLAAKLLAAFTAADHRQSAVLAVNFQAVAAAMVRMYAAVGIDDRAVF